MSIMRIRATIAGTQGLPGLSTWYYNGTTSTPSNADAADAVARVRAFFDGIKGLLPTANTVQVSGSVDLLDPATGALTGSQSVTAPSIVTGTGGGPLPPANAILLTGQTAVIIAGRRLRGRSFISPVASGTQTSGLVSSAAIATTITSANTSLTGVTSSVPVVWHRPQPPGPSGGSVSPVTTYSVGSTYAVLRSRRD